ncbi:MAG: hypothetical protein WDM87_13940 [Terracidiphilus sp.]
MLAINSWRLPTRFETAVEQVTPGDQCDQAESVEPREEVQVSGKIAGIGQHHVAANHDGREIKQRRQEQQRPTGDF